ncbi:hypothetical protein C5167_045156 [Papaver somniferum]|uniref:N-acetyltransferase domain-containing protein n=1 Tax=Papaver somniferum TaxID=3469 RepID=A0A4Y7LDU3_PAPSO|nr:uncharacterized protein LOC113323210 [Papaver somniferum]RZC82369.1 hypothetical protein C5167_045156 [Papaver somniferum]
MLLSMNHQTTRPNFLHFHSSCHGRRIPHKPPLLVSFPAKTEFNPKFLHCSTKSVFVSPATMEFNPKFLHSASKSVLVSPATMKFRPMLFALPRDNEEFSSDNEEEEPIIQEEFVRIRVCGASTILSHNGEYVVREAELEEEFKASAELKAEGLYEYRSLNDAVRSYEKEQNADLEFNVMMGRYARSYLEPFMCVIAVRKEGENMLQSVIGTLDLRVKYLLEGETYPEELVKLGNLYSNFKKGGSEKCGIITNVTVAESARQQGVGSSMLKFAIEAAKEKGGVKKIFLQVVRDNEPALALYRKIGFEILAEVTPQLEEQNLYLCSLNL